VSEPAHSVLASVGCGATYQFVFFFWSIQF